MTRGGLLSDLSNASYAEFVVMDCKQTRAIANDRNDLLWLTIHLKRSEEVDYMVRLVMQPEFN